jgi:ketosteroid isomerase-like protein
MGFVKDRIGIADAIAAYAHAIDAFDYDELCAAFTTDAIVRYQGHLPIIGNHAISDFLRERTAGTTWHQHFVSITQVDITGDEARTTSAFIAHAVGDDRPGLVRTICGSYFDRLARVENKWRIAERDQVTGIRHERALVSTR